MVVRLDLGDVGPLGAADDLLLLELRLLLLVLLDDAVVGHRDRVLVSLLLVKGGRGGEHLPDARVVVLLLLHRRGAVRDAAAVLDAAAAVRLADVLSMVCTRHRRRPDAARAVADGSSAGVLGSFRSATDLPRAMRPGFLPSSTDSAFSVCTICCSIAGICAAAVCDCDLACATFICEAMPYLNCSSNIFNDSL